MITLGPCIDDDDEGLGDDEVPTMLEVADEASTMEEVGKVTHFTSFLIFCGDFLRPSMAHSFHCVSSRAGGWR